jgi:ATP-dependent DNA helicase PIF1
VNGTAGSGKTTLIRALKQALGDRCAVLAPTGVAADNIGGQTYHSLLPVPTKGTREHLNRKDIRAKGKRDKKVVQALRPITHIIIDEMSMVGRRALGHIDEALRHGKRNYTDWFGGVNFILVGDHGQLSPVKDRRMYDWTEVRHMSSDKALHGKYLSSAPLWEKRGVEAYQTILDTGHVFFLHSVQRTNDERFRELQLRARDGLLTKEDWEYMRRTMDTSTATEAPGPSTHRLVSTREKRDEQNAIELEAAIDEGAPAITIDAINSGPAARSASDEETRLASKLHLCIGARVMITHNLSVETGLVNGTTGYVHDVVCDASGLPTSVLVLVKRRTETSEGYSGASFLESAHGVDMAKYAIVAIARISDDISNGSKKESRMQFPLMLAWAYAHRPLPLTLPPACPRPCERAAQQPCTLTIAGSPCTRRRG